MPFRDRQSPCIHVLRRQVRDPFRAERVRCFAEQPAQLRDRHRFGLMQLQVLLDQLGERDRPSAAGADPIKGLPQRLLRFRPTREPTHLRPGRASSFESVPVRPQWLAVRALRRQLEHLPLLDHLEPPRSTTGSRNQTALTTSLVERWSMVRAVGGLLRQPLRAPRAEAPAGLDCDLSPRREPARRAARVRVEPASTSSSDRRARRVPGRGVSG
jgi:hypothetical protein